MTKKITVLLFVLLAVSVACKKKSGDTATPSNPSTGTITTDSKSATDSTSPRDLTGTWIATEGPRTWELVITRTDANTWTTTPTLISNTEKDGLIDYGPPGSKGDAMIIISDGPGRFRVRWAKAENFHGADFWEGTGTYDDNSFNFAGHYTGTRKS
jgi:hypothetical protein